MDVNWKSEMILRKGLEWEDFQFLAHSRPKDQEWEAWMANEKWTDRFRVPFPRQIIDVFPPDRKGRRKREHQEERDEEAWEMLNRLKSVKAWADWTKPWGSNRPEQYHDYVKLPGDCRATGHETCKRLGMGVCQIVR
jgi:hypothetical protein